MVLHGTDETTVRTDHPQATTLAVLRQGPTVPTEPLRPLTARFDLDVHDKAFGRLHSQGDRIGQPHANRAFNDAGVA
jgi:hypothetical protein